MKQEDFLKQYDEVKKSLDAAEADITPFPVVTDDKLSVVGDPNKTEMKKNDYLLTFRFPKSMNVPNGIETPRGTEVQMEFNDIFITPRNDMDIVRLVANILPYFKKVGDNGEVGDLEGEEILQIAGELSDEVIDAMYDLVVTVLGVDPRLRDYITPVSIMATVVKFTRDFPEVVNEADTFFE